MGGGDVEAAADAAWQERQRRVRAALREAGRPDLAAELDGQLRDVRLGVAGARALWGALSGPQRSALAALAEGRTPDVRAGTVRALAQRGLVVLGRDAAGAPTDGSLRGRHAHVAARTVPPRGGA